MAHIFGFDSIVTVCMYQMISSFLERLNKKYGIIYLHTRWCFSSLIRAISEIIIDKDDLKWCSRFFFPFPFNLSISLSLSTAMDWKPISSMSWAFNSHNNNIQSLLMHTTYIHLRTIFGIFTFNARNYYTLNINSRLSDLFFSSSHCARSLFQHRF